MNHGELFYMAKVQKQKEYLLKQIQGLECSDSMII